MLHEATKKEDEKEDEIVKEEEAEDENDDACMHGWGVSRKPSLALLLRADKRWAVTANPGKAKHGKE